MFLAVKDLPLVLDAEQVMALYGIPSRDALYRWIRNESIPAPFRMNPMRWTQAAIEQHLAEPVPRRRGR